MKYIRRAIADKQEKSLPVRGAWIEINTRPKWPEKERSLPVRGAWIEMATMAARRTAAEVAPRKGSGD